MALQEAALLRLDPGLPAGSNAGRPAAAHWELQPVAAGLKLDEAAVEAAAAHAAAFDGEGEAGSAGHGSAGSEETAAGAAAGHAAAGGEPDGSEQTPMAVDADLPSEPDSAAAEALPLPPALAAQWLQSALPPASSTLRLLRPAAAAVLRALLVSRLCRVLSCALN